MLEGTYTESASFTQGAFPVTIVGSGATLVGSSTSDSAIAVSGTAMVTIRGLTIQVTTSTGSSTPAIDCNHATLTLRSVDVLPRSNSAVALNSTFCQININESKLRAVGSSNVAANAITSLDDQLQVNRSEFHAKISVSSDNSFGFGLLATNSVFLAPITYGGTSLSVDVEFSTFDLPSNPQACSVIDSSSFAVFKDDIFFGEGSSPFSGSNNTAGCTVDHSISYPASTPAGSITTADPRFVDRLNGDYHLKQGSPAIDAADPTSQNKIDFDGILRPQGPSYDIGAFEYKP